MQLVMPNFTLRGKGHKRRHFVRGKTRRQLDYYMFGCNDNQSCYLHVFLKGVAEYPEGIETDSGELVVSWADSCESFLVLISTFEFLLLCF